MTRWPAGRHNNEGALGDYFGRYDLFLTPTLAHPPIAHGTGDPSAAERRVLCFLHGTGILGVLARLGLLDKTVDKIATDNLRYVPFTQLSKLTGTPYMSVPLHWTAEGSPPGMQFMGPFGSEERLLQVARQLEEAQPWFDRLAPLACR